MSTAPCNPNVGKSVPRSVTICISQAGKLRFTEGHKIKARVLFSSSMSFFFTVSDFGGNILISEMTSSMGQSPTKKNEQNPRLFTELRGIKTKLSEHCCDTRSHRTGSSYK